MPTRNMERKILFHPKFAAGVDLFFSLSMLLILSQATVWWFLVLWILVRVGFWAALIFFTYHPHSTSRRRHLTELLFLLFGSLFLLLFIDWRLSWWIVLVFSAVLSAGSFWLIPEKESEMMFINLKFYRRWRFLSGVFSLFGMFCAVSAVPAFRIFSWLGLWPCLVFGALCASGNAFWWWREYEIPVDKKLWRATALAALFFFELLWVGALWPLGFLPFGLLMCWAWYVLWLLARFHLSPEGIKWNKQKLFLLANATLFVLFLIFVASWR